MSTAVPQPALCPFCGARVPRPGDMPEEAYEQSDGGRCVCGAVFAVDYTSHNLGRAMLDALCYAAGSPDLALELDSDEDFDEAIVEGYDSKSHRILSTKSPGYRGASLFFVRLRSEAAARLAGSKT